MANKKISELYVNSSPGGDSLLPIATSGITEAISLSGLSSFISLGLTVPIKNLIGPSDAIIINQGYQYLVYGDLTIQGILVNSGLITIINGNFINSGGTYINSGGTIELVSTTQSTTLIIKTPTQSGDTVDLRTSARKTFIKLNTLMSGDTNFICSDITNSQVGDTIYLSSPTLFSGTTFAYTFDDSFYVTTCGSNHEPQQIFFGGQTRDLIIFTFDGEKWMNTYDNC